MPTLYDLPIEALKIEEHLAETYGELTPELEALISEFMAAGKDKMEAAAMVVKSLESDAAVCKAEAKRLQERAAGLEKGAEKLKGLMLFILDETFAGKIKTAKFTIWGQNAGDVTVIELAEGANLSVLASAHPHLFRIPEPELDKKAIKLAKETGLEIPEGISISEMPGVRFLRIK